MKLSYIALLAAVAACSSTPTSTNDGGTQDASPDTGSSSGSGTVVGTMNGKTLNVVDAIALKGVYDSDYPGIVTIIMANAPQLCTLYSQLAQGALKANLFDLGFTLGATEHDSTVLVGTYTFSGSPYELDTDGWDSYDSACNHTSDTGTSAATVTLTSVGAVYQGTFDVTFNNGDHVTGGFSAPLCTLTPPVDDASTSGDSGKVCLP